MSQNIAFCIPKEGRFRNISWKHVFGWVRQKAKMFYVFLENVLFLCMLRLFLMCAHLFEYVCLCAFVCALISPGKGSGDQCSLELQGTKGKSGDLTQPQWLLPRPPEQGFSLSQRSSPVPNRVGRGFFICSFSMEKPNMTS